MMVSLITRNGFGGRASRRGHRIEHHSTNTVDADAGRSILNGGVVGVGSARNGDPVCCAGCAHFRAVRGGASRDAKGHRGRVD